MPETPGLADLEGTQAEAEDLARRFPAHKSSSVLRPPETRSRSDAQHLWGHFACHGSQDPSGQTKGALHLARRPIDHPANHEAPAPQSSNSPTCRACETNRGSTAIPDEAITLASALQIAGYQHVIATLWQIRGMTAVDIAKNLYNEIAAEHNGTAK